MVNFREISQLKSRPGGGGADVESFRVHSGDVDSSLRGGVESFRVHSGDVDSSLRGEFESLSPVFADYDSRLFCGVESILPSQAFWTKSRGEILSLFG